MCDSSCNPSVTPSQAHCRACCTTFHSVPAFDSHRTGDVDRRKCLSPETVGLQKFGEVWAPLSYQDTLDRLEVARASRGSV